MFLSLILPSAVFGGQPKRLEITPLSFQGENREFLNRKWSEWKEQGKIEKRICQAIESQPNYVNRLKVGFEVAGQVYKRNSDALHQANLEYYKVLNGGEYNLKKLVDLTIEINAREEIEISKKSSEQIKSCVASAAQKIKQYRYEKHAFASLPYVQKLISEQTEFCERALEFNPNAVEEYSTGSLSSIKPLAIEFATWQDKKTKLENDIVAESDLTQKEQDLIEKTNEMKEEALKAEAKKIVAEKNANKPVGILIKEEQGNQGSRGVVGIQEFIISTNSVQKKESVTSASDSQLPVDVEEQRKKDDEEKRRIEDETRGRKIKNLVGQGMSGAVTKLQKEKREQQKQKQEVFEEKNKINSSWNPFIFKTAGVGAFFGLGYLAWKNQEKLTAGADKMTNGAFSQYAAAVWNKVPGKSEFNFPRPQFSGFGLGINLGLFGSRAQSAFLGARSYVSNWFRI